MESDSKTQETGKVPAKKKRGRRPKPKQPTYRNNHKTQVRIVGGQRVCPGKTIELSKAVADALEKTPGGKAMLLTNEITRL